MIIRIHSRILVYASVRIDLECFLGLNFCTKEKMLEVSSHVLFLSSVRKGGDWRVRLTHEMAYFVAFLYSKGLWENDADPLERRLNVGQSQRVFPKSSKISASIALPYLDRRRKVPIGNHFYRVALYVKNRFCRRNCEPGEPPLEKRTLVCDSHYSSGSTNFAHELGRRTNIWNWSLI